MAQLPRQTRRLRPVVEDVAEVARRRRTVAHRGCNPTQLVGSDSSVTSGSTCHSPWHTTRAPFLGRRANRAHNTSGSSAGTYKGSYGAVRICPERWYRGATSRFGAAVCHARIGHDYRYPARKEDLPEVVHGLAEWSVEAGSSPIYNSRLVEAETVSTYRAPSGLCS
jgi:hypothetical protein